MRLHSSKMCYLYSSISNPTVQLTVIHKCFILQIKITKILKIYSRRNKKRNSIYTPPKVLIVE
uniref:Uncharacterized protein n=1 Tax=Rhizophora mucronata TaxID=61149 RepID=A0A2P2PIJ0_RHIMU